MSRVAPDPVLYHVMNHRWKDAPGAGAVALVHIHAIELC